MRRALFQSIVVPSAVFCLVGLHPFSTGASAAEVESEPPQLYVVAPKLVNLPASMGETVSAAIGQAAADEGLAVMTRSEARSIIKSQAELSMLGGDASGAALATLGRALGAQHVLTATVSAEGDDTVIHLRLVDAQKGTVLSREKTRATDFEGGLIPAVEQGTRLLLAPLFAHMKGTVALDVSEEGANVLLDGQQVGVTPVETLAVPGGMHMLTVTKKGFIRHQETLDVDDGDTIRKMLTLRPSEEFLQRYRRRNGLYRTLAWVTTAVALPLLAGSGTFFYLKDNQDQQSQALSADYEALPEDEKAQRQQEFERDIQASVNRANRFGEVAVGIGVGAVVSALTSGYFWLFGDDPDKYEHFE